MNITTNIQKVNGSTTAFFHIFICIALITISGCGSTSPINESGQQNQAIDATQVQVERLHETENAEQNLETGNDVRLASATEELQNPESTQLSEQIIEDSKPALKMDEATLQEIERIRNSIGISAFPLVDSDEQVGGSFSDALRDVTGNETNTAHEGLNLSTPSEATGDDQTASLPIVDHNQKIQMPIGSSRPDKTFSATLQTAIDALESQARIAEANRDYQIADQMRESAQSIRLTRRCIHWEESRK